MVCSSAAAQAQLKHVRVLSEQAVNCRDISELVGARDVNVTSLILNGYTKTRSGYRKIKCARPDNRSQLLRYDSVPVSPRRECWTEIRT